MTARGDLGDAVRQGDQSRKRTCRANALAAPCSTAGALTLLSRPSRSALVCLGRRPPGGTRSGPTVAWYLPGVGLQCVLLTELHSCYCYMDGFWVVWVWWYVSLSLVTSAWRGRNCLTTETAAATARLRQVTCVLQLLQRSRPRSPAPCLTPKPPLMMPFFDIGPNFLALAAPCSTAGALGKQGRTGCAVLHRRRPYIRRAAFHCERRAPI